MGVMDEIVRPAIDACVMSDPRTAHGLKLGYEWSYVREKILRKGLADFRKGYVPENSAAGPELSAADVVLLYCFGNMKRHFPAARNVFEAHRNLIQQCIENTANLVVVDVGCGPATGYLALTDVFPGHAFRYYGVDCAEAMREMAARFSRLLIGHRFVSPGSQSYFYDTWDKVRPDDWQRDTTVLFIFSYLFASLDRRACVSLLESVQRIRGHASVVKCFLAYMNSERDIANDTYRTCFRPGLGLPDQVLSPMKQYAALFEFLDISR